MTDPQPGFRESYVEHLVGPDGVPIPVVDRVAPSGRAAVDELSPPVSG